MYNYVLKYIFSIFIHTPRTYVLLSYVDSGVIKFNQIIMLFLSTVYLFSIKQESVANFTNPEGFALV